MASKNNSLRAGKPDPNPGKSSTKSRSGGREARRQAMGKQGRGRMAGIHPIFYASAAGLALGVLMIGFSLMSVAMASQAPAEASAPVFSPGDPRSKGSLDAPVVITEWLDFQCPACRTLALDRGPDIERQYIASGKVRFVYRDYAFLGPESTLAASAARCAADQGYYLAYSNLLFQRQQGENRGAFKADNLKRFASELGMDRASFDSCIDAETYRAPVVAESREAVSLGVRATPTLFINDRKIEGVPSAEYFKKLIEEELSKKSR